MKPAARNLATIVALLLLLVPALPASDKAKPSTDSPSSGSMTIWQAHRAIASTEHLTLDWLHLESIDRKSFRFTPERVEFDGTTSKGGTRHFIIDLVTLEAVSTKCDSHECNLTNTAGKWLQKNVAGGFLRDISWGEWTVPARTCSADCVYAAKSFAAALNHLRAFANDTESPLRTFTQRATAWRALPSKPPLPEEVRVQRLLAEDAVKQKNPREALNRYETGLELYPTWPEGNFNAALIAAELGFYADAVEHMQSYLELVPDAPDAQSARDQIVIWQYKAKETK